MRLERKKNAIRNSIWGILNRAIALLGPFLIRTLIIYMLGVEYLGLSSLFTSILQVLSMAELGFGSAIAFSMYGPIANNDEELICQLLNLYRKIYKIVGIMILGIGIIFMPFLHLFIHEDVPANINIYYLYLLYLFNASVSYFMFAYKSVLFSAFQREDVISKIYSALLIVQYGAQAVVLVVFRNYYCYYILVPAISIANNIITNVLSKKYYPQYRPLGKVPDDILKDVKEKVSGTVVSKFCGMTRNTFDSIIISSFLGLTTVAIYGNYFYILSNIASVLVIFVTSMKAGIGNSVALESLEKNYRDYNKFTFMYSLIASWCAICLLCLYQPFMELWVGTENMFPFYIVILLCIYFLWQTMGDITNAYSGAVGLWWENRYRTIFESICNLLLNIFLGYFWGVFGIVLATVITLFFFNFIWQTKILFNNYFKQYSVVSYIWNYIKYIFVTTIVGVFCFSVCQLVNINLFADLMIRGILCIIIPCILFYIIYKKDSLFTETRDFVLKVIDRRVDK
ncbi:MAG: hypothetical protein J1E64_00255 [Acetatifactor sp.]|nr:hypothetical protein [Acetatifactor sp.]